MIIRRSLTRLQRTGLIILGSALIVTGLFIVLSRERLVVFRHADTGLTFSHSPKLVETNVSEQDHLGGILTRFVTVQEEGVDLLITLRTERDLAKATALTAQQPIDIILDTITRTYPDRFPGFSELERRKFDQAGHSAAEISFTYDGETGDSVRQRFIAVMKDDDQALYLSLQAKATEFDAVNTRFFNTIVNSIAFN